MQRRHALVLGLIAVALLSALWFTGSARSPSPKVDLPDREGSSPARSTKPNQAAHKPRLSPEDPEMAPLPPPTEAQEPEPKQVLNEREPGEPPPPGITVWPATRDGIDGAIFEVLADIRGCYQEALAEVPGLQGDLKIRFAIEDQDGEGRIVEVGVASGALEDVPMEDCVLDVFEVLQFDPPEGGSMEVNYPLKFSSQ